MNASKHKETGREGGFYTVNEVAEYLNICRPTMYRLMSEGKFPKPAKKGFADSSAGPRVRVWWKGSDIAEWGNNREIRHTSNTDLLAELYKVLLMQQIWLEGCNYVWE